MTYSVKNMKYAGRPTREEQGIKQTVMKACVSGTESEQVMLRQAGVIGSRSV